MKFFGRSRHTVRTCGGVCIVLGYLAERIGGGLSRLTTLRWLAMGYVAVIVAVILGWHWLAS